MLSLFRLIGADCFVNLTLLCQCQCLLVCRTLHLVHYFVIFVDLQGGNQIQTGKKTLKSVFVVSKNIFFQHHDDDDGRNVNLVVTNNVVCQQLPSHCWTSKIELEMWIKKTVVLFILLLLRPTRRMLNISTRKKKRQMFFINKIIIIIII